jgi:hypothetical protein
MTLWTLRQVIEDQRIVAAGGHDLPIFINIAGGLLADGGFVDDACALVERAGRSWASRLPRPRSSTTLTPPSSTLIGSPPSAWRSASTTMAQAFPVSLISNSCPRAS